jgi:nucleotide-binding universal stress UspA family protein
MIRRLLVAVDDSPAALAAARLSMQLAAATSATVHAVAVVSPPALDGHLAAGAQRWQEAAAVLRYVAHLGEACGVAVETSLLAGEPAPRILDLARETDADVILVGLSRQRGPGEPYIGSQTRHILEFTESPVVVVPARPPG